MATSMVQIMASLATHASEPYVFLPTIDGRMAMFGAGGGECVEILDTGAGYRVTRLDARAWDLDQPGRPAPETHANLFDATRAAERMTGIDWPRMHRSGDAWESA